MNTEDLTKLICQAEAEKAFLERYWDVGICSTKYKEEKQNAIDEQIKYLRHFIATGDSVRCDKAADYLRGLIREIQVDHELGLMN